MLARTERQMFAGLEKNYDKISLKNNTCQLSSIKIDARMSSVHNTFHYTDMTVGSHFFLQKFLV
jgi:hypothetical protein